MTKELIYGRILTEQEKLSVSGGIDICITTSTVSGPSDGLKTDDTKNQGPGCEEPEPMSIF
jgi:hypothetical protein